MNGYSHIYLSPHLDDAVLSCGGRIWQQVQAGERVLVVTVFAGAPAFDVPFSSFAQELHARWGHLADAVVRRQEEDVEALALLRADAVHWPYTDCIYRRTPDGSFLYASEEALWGKVHPEEQGLVAELATRIAASSSRREDASSSRREDASSVVYAPLGVGRHVDHRVVRRAAEASGQTLVYYEDYPYAQDRQAVQNAQQGKTWRSELALLLSGGALEAKVAAVACYRSQLSTFWADEAEMVAAVGAFTERYWVLDA
jgi:LmbE family N-acetylglucosaminyl deacetylase